ncbi:MAG: dTDP-4-dehydrorhamnose reductase [Candidatus Omnitrophota bacterium]
MVAKTKKILITGAQGMLGQMLQNVFSNNYQVLGLDIQGGNIIADISKKDDVIKEIIIARPDYIIHTAAFTDVDECEKDITKAYLINRKGTKYVSLAAAEINAVLIYLSTDYVFDGNKTSAYIEDDLPNPINAYGRTKLAGEKAVQQNLDKYFIVRTSWLYGNHGKNFVSAILSKAKSTRTIKVVTDQIGAPTYSLDLAEAINELIAIYETRQNDKKLFGIYNITNSGFCTWYDFAKEIVNYLKIRQVKIIPITSQDLGRPALRPKNSRLDNTKYNRLSNKPLPSWEKALESYLSLRLYSA